VYRSNESCQPQLRQERHVRDWRHVAPLELENLWLATSYTHAARTGLAEWSRGQLLETAPEKICVNLCNLWFIF
jgi:hypothetical protein